MTHTRRKGIWQKHLSLHGVIHIFFFFVSFFYHYFPVTPSAQHCAAFYRLPHTSCYRTYAYHRRACCTCAPPFFCPSHPHLIALARRTRDTGTLSTYYVPILLLVAFAATYLYGIGILRARLLPYLPPPPPKHIPTPSPLPCTL